VNDDHDTVWLVLEGSPEQRGTVWLDSTNTDYGGWYPTGRDFLIYYYEYILERLAARLPIDPVRIDELEPIEALRLYSSSRYSPQLYAHPDAPAQAALLMERAGRDQRAEAVRLVEDAAGAGMRFATRGARVNERVASVALALLELARARAVGSYARTDRIRRGLGHACDDLECFAIIAGEYDRGESLAREGLEHGCSYRDNHAVHLVVARALAGRPVDQTILPRDPNYDVRAFVLIAFLQRQEPTVRSRVFAALPAELRLGWLVARGPGGFLFEVDDRFARVADTVWETLERIGDGALREERESGLAALLSGPGRELRAFLKKPIAPPETAAERHALGRAWHGYSVLVSMLSGQRALWDVNPVREAISEAESLGIDADWVGRACTELERDVLDPSYVQFLERVLPRIRAAGPAVLKSFGMAAALQLSPRARARVADVAARVVVGLEAAIPS
jgi:hypothetical protein